VTTLGQHIENLDMPTWAAMTKLTAERAIAAAEEAGQQPPELLVAVAKMSETELIDARHKNIWHSKRRPPTVRMRLIEAEHLRALAEQRVQGAEQDRKDAIADAAAARAEAQQSAAAAEEARNRTRAVNEELWRKEQERTAEQHDALEKLESLRNELTQARAFETAARADAQESAAAAEAAKKHEVAALDKFARQGAQLAGAQRKLETALKESRASEEKMRNELDQVRADNAAQIAAAVEHASAADQRAEERLAERAADRREAQAEVERLRGEIVRIRSDAETEIAAALERTKAAENRALQRMSERAAAQAEARETIEKLQAYLERARIHAVDEVHTAREQAVLAIATARQHSDQMVARIRAETQQQIDEAIQARAEAESVADTYRAQAQSASAPSGGGLTVPIPGWTVRPATRRIENALTAMHQINYILEVGMAEEVEAEIPLDAELVARLARAVQREAQDLRQEFVELPARFSEDSQVEAAADYAKAASVACRAFLRRIGSAAEHLRDRSNGPDVEVVRTVRRMLADPRVQELFSESADA
jgi:colicin import membrane protein